VRNSNSGPHIQLAPRYLRCTMKTVRWLSDRRNGSGVTSGSFITKTLVTTPRGIGQAQIPSRALQFSFKGPLPEAQVHCGGLVGRVHPTHASPKRRSQPRNTNDLISLSQRPPPDLNVPSCRGEESLPCRVLVNPSVDDEDGTVISRRTSVQEPVRSAGDN
jgi:hypothetical protein